MSTTETPARALLALGVEIAIRIDPDADELLRALGPLVADPSDLAPAAEWSIERGPDGWTFHPGMSQPSTAPEAIALLGRVVDSINQLVTRRSPEVSVHAGAIAVGDRGVLLTGPAEAGKSTLTAGCVLAGASYLGDEAIGIDGASGRLLAYPKPLSLDPGSHGLFPGLAALAIGAPESDERWNVPVDAIRDDAISTGAALEHVVFCQYEQGSRTTMVDISRAEGVYELADHTFRFKARARPSLETLSAAVRGASCHRLVVGDLDEAVAAVLGLVRPSAVTWAPPGPR